MSVISIFVCDDHEILREGLRSLFGMVPDLQWIGEASEGESALAQIPNLKPDVILMDLLMPGLGEIELIRQVKNTSPASKILVLTSSQEEDMVTGCLMAGASGYLLKTCSTDTLVQGIRDVAGGNMVLTPHLLKTLPAMLQNQHDGRLLSQRELEVLKLIAQGQSNRLIAQTLHISENTIVSHVAHILDKLRLENRTQVALYARRRGLV